MKKLLLLTIIIILCISLTNAQNVGHFFGSTDGSESIDLKLGNENSNPNFRFYSSDNSGSNLRFHARRWSGNFFWSRESSGSTDRNIAELFGSQDKSYFCLFDHDQNIKVNLASEGVSYFSGSKLAIGTTSSQAGTSF